MSGSYSCFTEDRVGGTNPALYQVVLPTGFWSTPQEIGALFLPDVFYPGQLRTNVTGFTGR